MRAWREDFIELKSPKIKNGIFYSAAKIGRSGVQEYLDEKGQIIRELRTPDDLLQNTKTFSYLPITLNHPSTMIGDSNADFLTKGFSSDCFYKNGWLYSTISIHKKDAIQSALTTHQQLSLGYYVDLILQSGTWIDELGIQGEAGKSYLYDRIQKNFEGNHLALVPKARAGEKATFKSDSHHQAIAIRFDQDLSIPNIPHIPQYFLMATIEKEMETNPSETNSLTITETPTNPIQKMQNQTQLLEQKIIDLQQQLNNQPNLEQEIKLRQDTFNLAKPYLKNPEFNATFTPHHWQQQALKDTLSNLKLDGLSDSEIALRFEILLEMYPPNKNQLDTQNNPQEAIKKADAKLATALDKPTHNHDLFLFNGYPKLPQDFACGRV